MSRLWNLSFNPPNLSQCRGPSPSSTKYPPCPSGPHWGGRGFLSGSGRITTRSTRYPLILNLVSVFSKYFPFFFFFSHSIYCFVTLTSQRPRGPFYHYDCKIVDKKPLEGKAGSSSGSSKTETNIPVAKSRRILEQFALTVLQNKVRVAYDGVANLYSYVKLDQDKMIAEVSWVSCVLRKLVQLFGF